MSIWVVELHDSSSDALWTVAIRCTPPEEAVPFHNGLLENGVKSVLVTYTEEGHGVRKLPAAIDYATRVVAWFEEHMTATPAK